MKENQIKDNSNKIGQKIIQVINASVDYLVLIIILLLLTFASYYVWDSNQIYKTADSTEFEIYKPEVDKDSFDELKKINPEVFAWIEIYGTNIDYPVVQSKSSNDKYLRTDAFGNYSMAGSIFLDHRNNQHFSDFNSIIYGHYMQRAVMFGEIAQFKNKSYFDERKYGNLYYDEKDHGLEFFAFIETDGNNSTLYSPSIVSKELQRSYLSYIDSVAINKRNLDINISDNIVLLSTCSSERTNGRHILVARITDETFDDPFDDKGGADKFSFWGLFADMPIWGWALLLIFLLILLTLLDRKKRKGKL